jgi:ribose transport system permease protein
MSTNPDAKSRFTFSDRQKDIIQKFAALGSLVLLTVVFSATSSAFFTVNNAMTIALQVTSIALLGFGACRCCCSPSS